MELSTISSFKPGSTIRGFYICQEKNHKNTKNGNSYLDIILTDKTGTIKGKIWDSVDHFDSLFEASNPVAVKGKVEDYNSTIQLVVHQIKMADEVTYNKYGFSLTELIQTVDEPIEELWSSLLGYIKSLNSPYRELINSIIKNYNSKIKRIPASINGHRITQCFSKRGIS